MKRKQIIIAGLISDTNLGDPLLVECCKRLYCKVLNKCNIDVSFIDCNLRYQDSVTSVIAKKIFSIARKTKKYIPNIFIVQFLSLGVWLQMKSYLYYFKKQSPNAIIIAGGGVIHFKFQHYLQNISALILFCKKKNIPLIINSVGIEEYDHKDIFFRFYKTYLNSSVVKAFTTRDYLESLKDDIIFNSNIYVDLEPDNAILSSKLFHIYKSPSSHKIGIGIIRPNIFDDFQNINGVESIVELYKYIVDYLEQANINFDFFSNGAESDMKLIELLENKTGKHYQVRVANDYIDLMHIISKYNGIIVGRMHASIIGYSMDIPTIGLNWCRKVERFFELINRKDFILSLPFNVNSISNIDNILDLFIKESFEDFSYNKSRRADIEKMINDPIEYIVKHFLDN